MKTQKIIQDLKSKGAQVKVVHYRYLDQDIKKIKAFEQRLSHGYKQLTTNEHEALAQIFDFKLYPTGKVSPKDVSPLGGRTEVEIIFQDGTHAFGEAYAVLPDNYEKRRGVNMALGRALKNAERKILA